MYNSVEYPKIYNIQVYGKGCAGCIRHQKDIMITYAIANEKEGELANITEIGDLFLSTEQAGKLIESLQKHLEYNKQEYKHKDNETGI